MFDHFYAVIMAGGGGTRLWPLSRKSKPKQMLRLGSSKSLFELATDRLEGLFPPEHILVVTVAEQAEKLQELAPLIPKENYLIEPMPRGTASVVGLAAVALQKRDPQAVMAILTADHFIENVQAFQGLLKSAYEIANAGYLVTLGIRPTYPSIGYGYIQRGEPIDLSVGTQAYEVLRFREKPDEATAQQFVQRNDHDWNSGMFIWRVDRILDEIHSQMPELAVSLDEIAAAWDTDRRQEVIQRLWPALQTQTVDYGIMESARRVAVLPGTDLGWNDVGSWESLFDVLPIDENGNIVLDAQHLNLNSKKSLILSDLSNRLIVTIGVEDLVIVDTGDALLIAKRDQSQRVKDVVQALKDQGQADYL